MDAIEVLTQDHRTVEELFSQIEETDDPTARQPLVDAMVQALTIHAQAEEELFYPALADAAGEDSELAEMVREALEEHHVAKMLLGEISALEPTAEALEAKITVLKENVEHHVEEEEGDLFDQARDALDREALDRIGQALAARLMPDAVEGEGDVDLDLSDDDIDLDADAGELADLSKQELLERAKKAGVTGRSSMNKEELAEAVASAEAGRG